jgi:hypothetical protein
MLVLALYHAAPMGSDGPETFRLVERCLVDGLANHRGTPTTCWKIY